ERPTLTSHDKSSARVWPLTLPKASSSSDRGKTVTLKLASCCTYSRWPELSSRATSASRYPGLQTYWYCMLPPTRSSRTCQSAEQYRSRWSPFLFGVLLQRADYVLR